MKRPEKKEPLTDFVLSFKGDVYKYCELLGFEPNWQQREYLDAYQEAIDGTGKPNIACRAGKGPGKCVLADMVVYDRNRGVVKVGDIVGKNIKILSMSKKLQMEYKSAVCKKSTIQKCTEIITDSGNNIKISSQHKVFTQRGWIKAKEITTKDLMAVPREFDLKNKGISQDDCAFLGYLIGDGGLTERSGATFTQEDNDTLKRFISIAEKIGKGVTRTSKYSYYVKGVTTFLKSHKLIGKLSKHKQIPEAVWVSGKRGMASFLLALWECDGYSTKDGYGICLTSKRLVYDIQTALASFRVHTSVRYKKSKCGDKYFDAWRLEVCGSDNLQRWMDTIGEVIGKPLKQGLLDKKANSNKDIIPIYDKEWNYVCKEIGMSNNRLRDFGIRGVSHACLGRKKFEAFVELFGYKGKYKKWAKSQVRWVKVKSCGDIGDQQTYDVSVEDNHNFVCNHVIVHNTKATAVSFTHWSVTHPKSSLIVTAPTFRQCQEVWLSEAYDTVTSTKADPRIAQLFNFRGKGYGILGAKNSDWGCQLVTALKKEAFQGIHNKYLAFLEEEASGVPNMISNAITETLSNAEGTYLHVRIGNPNCVVGDTEIYDTTKGRIAVKDLAGKGFCRVVSMNETTEKIDKYDAVAVYSGEKECVRLSVNTGQQIELSTDHPMYTPNGWAKAGELCEKDLVAMPRKLALPDTYTKMGDSEVRAIAYFISDGNTSKGAYKTTARCSFTNADKEIIDEFTLDIEALGGGVKKVGYSGKAETLSCTGMQEYLRKWKISRCLAKTKRVPSDIFLLCRRQLGLFLNRIWACDGSFNRYGPKICLSNKKLIDDIQTLLLREGIHSSSWYTPTRVKYHHKTSSYLKGRIFDAWTLGITELSSQVRWQKLVGPVLTKEDKMVFAKGNNPNCDIVPIDNSKMNEIYAEMGLPVKGRKKGTLTAVYRKKYRRVRRLSRKSFGDFCRESEYDGKYSNLACNDIRWVRLTGTERIGPQPVYDLSVPDAGNFVANNLIVHNTRLCAFFDSFNKEKAKWKRLHWNTEETPETDYFSKRRNKEIEEEFGKNSDVYRISVLGEFPNLDPNCLIAEEDLEACCTPETLNNVLLNNPDVTKQIGIDLARYGGDENVVVPRQGGIMFKMWAEKTDPNNAIDKGIFYQDQYGWDNKDCLYVVDTSGMGEVAVGALGDKRRMGKRVHEFYSQNTAHESTKYCDKITEAWCLFAKAVKDRKVYLGEKLDKKLKVQLTTRRYVVDRTSGRIKIESKDDYAKNMKDAEHGTIGKSPDRADGVVMAFYPHATESARIAVAR